MKFSLLKALSLSATLLTSLLMSGVSALPAVQAAPELVVELGHSSAAGATVFSPDGKLFAAAGEDGSIRVWDAARGAWRNTFSASSISGAGCLVFSPDGKWLAAGGNDGAVSLWRVPENLEQAPDAPRVFKFGEGKVNWRVGDKTVETDARRGDEAVTQLAFSPDGSTLAAGGYAGRGPDVKAAVRLRVWNVGSGESKWTRVFEESTPPLLAFTGNDALVSAHAPNTVQTWNAQSGEPGAILTIPEESARNGSSVLLALSPDGSKILTKGKGDYKIYGLPGLQVVSTLEVNVVPEDPEVARRRHEQMEKILGRPVPERAPLTGSALLGGASLGTWSPDGKRLAVVFGRGEWRVWNADDGKQIQSFTPRGEKAAALAFSPDGSTLAGGDISGALRAWDVESAALKFTLRSSRNPVSFLGFAAGAGGAPLLVAGHDAGVLALWNLKTGKFERADQTPDRDLAAMAVSPDGKFLAAGGYLKNYSMTMRDEGDARGQVRVLDLASGKTLWERPDATFGKIRDLQFWPGGKLLAVAMGDRPSMVRRGLQEGEGFSSLDFVDATTGQSQTPPLDFGDEPISETEGLAIAANASRIAVSDPNQLRAWNVAGGKLLWKTNGGYYDAPRLAFSPDGRWLATAEAGRRGGGAIRLWDATKERGNFTPSPDADLSGHAVPVQSLEYSADGKTLWSADESGVIHAWDIAAQPQKEAKPVQSFAGDGVAVLKLKAAPEALRAAGVSFAASSSDGKIRLWNAATGKVVATLLLIAPPPVLPEIGKPLIPAPAVFDWIVYTPDGFYDASPGALNFIHWRENGKLYPAEKFEPQFHRPDAVQKALSGK